MDGFWDSSPFCLAISHPDGADAADAAGGWRGRTALGDIFAGKSVNGHSVVAIVTIKMVIYV